jgi:hypothetical protein
MVPQQSIIMPDPELATGKEIKITALSQGLIVSHIFCWTPRVRAFSPMRAFSPKGAA